LKVSIIIPTIWERESDLRELLYYIRHQTVLPYEVIVVTDGNIMHFKDILMDYIDCSIKFKPILIRDSPLGMKRNVGIKKTTCDYILFLDDDVLPNRSWLFEMKKSLEDGADLIGGPSKPLFPNGLKIPRWWDESLIGRYVAVGNGPDRIWGCNLGIKKRVITDIGYFDESLGPQKGHPSIYGEDVEFVNLVRQKKLSVMFNPRAVVYHKLNAERLCVEYYKKRAVKEGYSIKELSKRHNKILIVEYQN